jgi:hypothetical protein
MSPRASAKKKGILKEKNYWYTSQTLLFLSCKIYLMMNRSYNAISEVMELQSRKGKGAKWKYSFHTSLESEKCCKQ